MYMYVQYVWILTKAPDALVYLLFFQGTRAILIKFEEHFLHKKKHALSLCVHTLDTIMSILCCWYTHLPVGNGDQQILKLIIVKSAIAILLSMKINGDTEHKYSTCVCSITNKLYYRVSNARLIECKCHCTKHGRLHAHAHACLIGTSHSKPDILF